MKSPLFDYVRPSSLEQVFDLLAEHGEDAKIIAGGQTLLATLNMRLSEPKILIDLRDVAGLRGISLQHDHVRIGTLTRHSEIEDSPVVARNMPLLSMAAPHVAHRAIRNRGTIGGAISYADPAAEWPACALALDAKFLLKSRRGERRVEARDFFLDLYTTDMQRDEILVACMFSLPKRKRNSYFNELVRRHGDYAIVGVAAEADFAENTLANVRLAFMGMGTVPILAQEAAQILDGTPLDQVEDSLRRAAETLEGALKPIADIYNSAETKLHLAKVLLTRAVHSLAVSEPQESF